EEMVARRLVEVAVPVLVDDDHMRFRPVHDEMREHRPRPVGPAAPRHRRIVGVLEPSGAVSTAEAVDEIVDLPRMSRRPKAPVELVFGHNAGPTFGTAVESAAGEDAIARPDRELVTVFADVDPMARLIGRHRGDLPSGEERKPGLVEVV